MISLNGFTPAVSTIKPSSGISVRFSGASAEEIAKRTLEFKPHKPWKTLQVLGIHANRLILKKQGITVTMSEKDMAELRKIPQTCGNILVSGHPDSTDGAVIMEAIRKSGRRPSGFMIANDALQKKPGIIRFFMNRAGAIPVVRGNAKKEGDKAENTTNSAAKTMLIDKVSNGSWINIFPEGSIYISRDVMEMEYGSVLTTMEAAVASHKRGDKKPVYLTTFSHVYFHTDLAEMERNMIKALDEMEDKLEIPANQRKGTLREQMLVVAQAIIKQRLKLYGIPADSLANVKGDMYDQGAALRTILLEGLEKEHLGGVKEGRERRRSFNIRAKLWNDLTKPGITDEEKAKIKLDIKKTEDIVTLVSFNRDYRELTGDIEMWGEFIRRMRSSLDLSEGPFGKREAVVKLLKVQNMQDYVPQYLALPDDVARKQFLFDLTAQMRDTVRQGVIDTLKERGLGKKLD